MKLPVNNLVPKRGGALGMRLKMCLLRCRSLSDAVRVVVLNVPLNAISSKISCESVTKYSADDIILNNLKRCRVINTFLLGSG